MNSRERILQRLKNNQPRLTRNLPSVDTTTISDPKAKFITTVTAIGATVVAVSLEEEIPALVNRQIPTAKNVISNVSSLRSTTNEFSGPHELSAIDIAVLKGEFAVAENGAIWITEKNMIDRALPFICENLMLLIDDDKIVQNLHEAYSIIGDAPYAYGTFIAGPSKTADIEQSLVLGAHGPKTLTIFLLSKNN